MILILHTLNFDRLFGMVVACWIAIQKVLGSIPGYTLEIFLEV